MTAPSAQPAVTLYEQEALQAVTGGCLRPGGLALTAELLELAGLAPGAQVLDIGCGPGHSLRLMADAFAFAPTGLDPSPAMCAQARQNTPGITIFQAEAVAIPCPARNFDGVLCECVLSLTGDIEKSLKEMYRVLRPGGILILTDIYCQQPEWQPDLPGLKSCVSQALPLSTIRAGLDLAGFTVSLLQERTNLLKQLAGQIIFSHGSLTQFWQLFMGAEAAQRTSCALAAAPLGYYALIARTGEHHG